MRTVKIGFIPSHRVPFGEEWARQMRQRCVVELREIEGLDLVVPDEQLSEGGLVRSRDDGLAVLDLFRREKVSGVVVGGMTFGHETSAVGVVIAGLERGTPVLQFSLPSSTSFPAAIASVALTPRFAPLFIASRNRSPVEIWGTR